MTPMGNLVWEDLESVTSAASRGESAALHTLYDALAPRVCGYLRVRGSEDPEGLTNEVFVKVLPRVAEVTGGYRGLRALTFTVAHGLLVDELRHRARQPVLHEYDSARDRRTQSSAEELALDQLAEGTVLELLDLLPDDQRSVILLRFLGELSTYETATVMGRSQAAVKKMQAKALDALRRLLENDGPDPGSTDEEVGQ